MIQIVYACNDKYLDCLQLSILSILRRTEQNIHFYVLTMDFTNIKSKYTALTDKHALAMKQFVKSFNPKNEFTKIDCTKYYNKYLKGNKSSLAVCSPYTNLRLIIDKLDLKGKVLYLDTDTMCCGDIKELYDIKLKGKSLGANQDHLGRFWHPQSRKYFNAGVLSIDLDKARKTKFFDYAREQLFRRKFKLADQTVLFIAAKKTNSFMIFPEGFRYNTQQPRMLPNTLIKHFCAGWVHGRWQSIKQTNINAVHKKLKIHTFDDDFEVWKKNKII